MIVFDSHMHLGQFYDNYYSPNYIASFINEVNVSKVAISSTTICDENYGKVIDEFNNLINLSGSRIFPVLWITPKMLKSNNIKLFLKSKIKWRCIKIHGFIHNWNPNGELFKSVICLAKALHVPILIHTGGVQNCFPLYYLKIIKKNPEQIFILAHGRPIDQTIEVMSQCENAWTDTAFMPIKDVKVLIENELEDRILFGTDYPITKYYDNETSGKILYKSRLSELASIMNVSVIEKILTRNFDIIFKSKPLHKSAI